MFAQDFGAIHYDLDWDLQGPEWDWRGLNDMTEPGLAPSEDFWKKFEELPDLGEDLESLFDVDVNDMNLTSVLMNHDCMWAGTCLNKDHKPENKPPPPPPPAPDAPVIEDVVMPPAPPSPATVAVKKRVVAVKSPVVRVKNEPPRPDTPPSLSESEEEESADDQKPTIVPVIAAANQTIRRTIQTSAFDHNYDKTVRPEDYGLQTPSDSEEDQNQSSASEEEEEDDEEEEIDVVSLTRDSLPTNPTREIRTQLQKKVATAISTNTLLSAKRAVSRRLKQTKKTKRKRASSDEDDDIDVKPTFYTPQTTPRRNWRKTPKKSRFSDSEPDSERRSIHNNMERMRRIDLRNAFDDLKGLLPSLVDAQRAPKVAILKDATSYLHELRQKERTLSQHVTKLRSHQEELRSTLSRLRKTLAAIR
uniref:N-myc proto-oncogene protein n=1 Tax=Lygus hesperus TaxID=30085 RepID=A0A146KJA0_LYGHE